MYIRSLNPLAFLWNFILEGFIKIYHIWLRPDTHKVALREHVRVHALESVSRI
jgi:hypothetical protein